MLPYTDERSMRRCVVCLASNFVSLIIYSVQQRTNFRPLLVRRTGYYSQNIKTHMT